MEKIIHNCGHETYEVKAYDPDDDDSVYSAVAPACALCMHLERIADSLNRIGNILNEENE